VRCAWWDRDEHGRLTTVDCTEAAGYLVRSDPGGDLRRPLPLCARHAAAHRLACADEYRRYGWTVATLTNGPL
jgi:hypothetical protein